MRASPLLQPSCKGLLRLFHTLFSTRSVAALLLLASRLGRSTWGRILNCVLLICPGSPSVCSPCTSHDHLQLDLVMRTPIAAGGDEDALLG